MKLKKEVFLKTQKFGNEIYRIYNFKYFDGKYLFIRIELLTNVDNSEPIRNVYND